MSTPALVRGFEIVIGLETHTQLSTRAKIFSGASTAFGAPPNSQASAVDLALPGTLPVLNRGAVERAIRFGLAVSGRVAPLSIFARKNYFYPDLPKGYQISQYETPVVQGGKVSFFVDGEPRTVNLTRAHLEEDAGKSLHENYQDQTGIDLNRAGTPLLEIVTEPDMRTSAEAVEYAKALHAMVVWLGICDGNMQEGSFRCDANVSVRRPGAPFGIRREIKNLNSFRFMQQAIDYEVQWQIDLIEDGGEVRQATVLFDPDSGETRAMRTKEDAHDYRYFPDPDLPPLAIAGDWIERVRAEMPELPQAMAARFAREHALPLADAAALTQSLATAQYFEAALAEALRLQAQPRAEGAAPLAKLVVNWMMGELSRRLNSEGGLAIDDAPVKAPVLAKLVCRIADGTLSSSGAKQVFDALWIAGGVGGSGSSGMAVEANVATSPKAAEGPAADVDAIIEAQGLRQVSDAGALGPLIDAVVADNPRSVSEYRSGKEKAFNALVGQVMKATRGKANPEQVGKLLKDKLR